MRAALLAVLLVGCIGGPTSDGLFVVMVADNGTDRSVPAYVGGHAPGDLEAWDGAGRAHTSAMGPDYTEVLSMWVTLQTARSYEFEIRLGNESRIFPYEGCTTLWTIRATLTDDGGRDRIGGTAQCTSDTAGQQR